MHDVVIFTRKDGTKITAPLLKAVIQQAQSDLRDRGLSSQRAIDAIVKTALYAGGRLFIDVFLMKRFDPSYARSVLGYHATAAYEREKVDAANAGRPLNFRAARGIGFASGVDYHGGVVQAPQPRPFVASGASMELVRSTARVNVTSQANIGKGIIRVQCNPGMIRFTKQYGAFKTISAIEYQRVMQAVQAKLRELMPQTGPGLIYGNETRWTGRPLDRLGERQGAHAG